MDGSRRTSLGHSEVTAEGLLEYVEFECVAPGSCLFSKIRFMAMESFVWEDQAPLLRQLPLNLVELLWANDWRCPFLLDTGFDTELEAYTLVAGLPGSTETAATNRRFARILVAWSLRNCSTIQRLRKRAASTDPYQQAATLQEFRERHSARTTPFIPSASKVLFSTNHWRNRRERRKAKADGLDSRKLVEEDEKARWVKHVVNVLKEAKVPVCVTKRHWQVTRKQLSRLWLAVVAHGLSEIVAECFGRFRFGLFASSGSAGLRTSDKCSTISETWNWDLVQRACLPILLGP